MSMDFIQESHLLSSISNISVKIDYNERDDLGFFHNSVHQNQILYQNQKYAVINAIPNQVEFDGECLFENILAKVSTETNASPEENNIWVFDDEELGHSQEISRSIQIKQPKLQPSKKSKIIKRKSSNKKKNHKKHKKGQTEEMRRTRIQNQVRQRNQTKNIPKNYGKAIITFASKHNTQVKNIAESYSINYDDFRLQLKEVKKSICTIADLRKLWVEFRYAQLMRIVGDLFLRKYALKWVFNSKISNVNAHVKYRCKLLQAIKEPDAFQYMKNY